MVVVLATKKDTAIVKGKDRDIEKWEAEVRKTIASKKAAGNTVLSKQDKALVDAQLKIENETRKKVEKKKIEVERAFGLIQSLFASGVDQIEGYASPVLALLLGGALQRGTPLVGPLALQTYFVRCSARCLPLQTDR